MKAHLTKVSLALLSTVFLLGCQDMGSEPVGPEGPQFIHNDPGKVHGGPKGGGNGDGVVEPGTLFSRPGGVGASDGYTCGGGAASSTSDPTFGTVNFNQPRDDSHTHANVQLRGVTEGVYLIWGNHDKVCLAKEPDPNNPKLEPFNFPVFDFPLRPAHATKVTVGANGKGKARIGLTYVTETPRTIVDDDKNVIVGFNFSDEDLSKMHADGDHRLWVTVTGPVDPVTLEPLDVTQVFLRSVAVVVTIPVH